MNDPWRMRSMGSASNSKLPKCPHRRSTRTTKHHRRKQPDISGQDSEEFSDVFGVPPRIILSRQFSYSESSSSPKLSFYMDIFRPTDPAGKTPEKGGRSLPEFRIPGQVRKTSDGFYSNIFGCVSDDHESCEDNNSMSSPEISPLKGAIYGDEDDDEDVSFLNMKLRPINVQRRSSSSRKVEPEDDFSRGQPSFTANHAKDGTEKNDHERMRSYAYGRLSRKYASPETVSLEPISTGSFKLSADDLETKSPSSSSSSSEASLILRKDTELRTREIDDLEQEQADDEEEEDEDEVNIRSYVIEISSDLREGSCESNNDIDEAIAWAKEKFQQAKEVPSKNQLSEGCIDSLCSSDIEQINKENSDVENQTLLDEKIRLWSTGKEGDIRLLLSSLHNILWANSGWSPRSIAELIGISQVKKAYQRARLCLHPDKLQQRGAVSSQKYIADKAFSILQDAWTSFISRNTCDDEA